MTLPEFTTVVSPVVPALIVTGSFPDLLDDILWGKGEAEETGE